jgi:transcriptional regulator with XRE-family HTH domain
MHRFMPKRKYEPHRQLKLIRKALGKTQQQLAHDLQVSYPYLLSVETGQRNMSDALARKISWFFGLPGVMQIRFKRASPMCWDPVKEDVVRFTKEAFERYRSRRPAFHLRSTGTLVSPPLFGYAKALRALLESAEEQGRLAEILRGFFEWFSSCVATDAQRADFDLWYRKIYPKGDSSAKEALLDYRDARRPKR